MKPEDFSFLSKFLLDRTGLVLGPDKTYLIESRLGPIARKWRFSGLDELVTAIRQAKNDDMVREATDAMMTNESFFFRDIKPFEQFRQVVLPHLIQGRAARRQIRIWSAACSTGQEPYTLGMILKEEAAKIAGWKLDIVATDISKDALDRAKAGCYTQFEAQRGLPIQMLVKYFKQEGDKWQIVPELRAMVQFRDFNLLTDPSALGQFDVVFCRNVLIYFDQATKGAVLARIARMLAPDGMLYLGGAETVLGVSEKFVPLLGQRGIYTLVNAAAARQAATA
ncbi:MAG: protein-glutamate O-methyltransferase [Proteobacteria bacterium]|nr:protein-glutamate O-methyltransferase [Pseudomonadota bacterium]